MRTVLIRRSGRPVIWFCLLTACASAWSAQTDHRHRSAVLPNRIRSSREPGRKKPSTAASNNAPETARRWVASSCMEFEVHSEGREMYIEWANPPVPGIGARGKVLRNGKLWQGTLIY